MELNTKFISDAHCARVNGVVRVTDYKGDTLLSMTPGATQQGDLVAIVNDATGHQLYTLSSRFELDTLLKRRFMGEMNTLLAKSPERLELADYGIWYRDERSGVEYINNTPLQ